MRRPEVSESEMKDERKEGGKERMEVAKTVEKNEKESKNGAVSIE